ncbi:hypothetical protein B0H14DRAFT_2658344 [Mycena olivaceomarginata]|nr:hypothetical protein B0H14DRAFT_2658344 [Mycena olivaceomarginata]
MAVPSRFPKLVDARRVKVLLRHLRLWTGAAGNRHTGRRPSDMHRAGIEGPGGEEEVGIEYRAAGNERAWGGDQACGRRAVGQGTRGRQPSSAYAAVSWAWAQARAAGNEREGEHICGDQAQSVQAAGKERTGGGHRARMEWVSWANRGRGGSGRAAHRRRLSTVRVGAETAANEGGGQQARMGREQA